MDTAILVEALRATIDPKLYQFQAELKLAQLQNRVEFAPILLQVIMGNDVPMPVRQNGALRLNKFITSTWEKKVSEESDPIKFSTHKQCKAAIKNLIVDAIVQVPDIIKVELSIGLKTITKHDFPTHWPEVVHKIFNYLQYENYGSWMGALLCLYNIIKNYENRPEDERGPLTKAMELFLPIIYNIIVKLRTDQSAESVLIQKQILKCYYSIIDIYLVKNSLNYDLLPSEVLTNWLEVLQLILSQPVPEHTLAVDEDKRLELPWWKVKKWALHILLTHYKRFGSPLSVPKIYTLFSAWYLYTFTSAILEVLSSILDQYKNKMYVSPRVLQGTFDYLNHCVEQRHSWKLLHPQMSEIIQDVLFPMLCHTDSDEKLWNTNPQKYIQMKFCLLKNSVSPMISAQKLISSACKGRKDMFGCTMQLCSQVLNNQNGEYGPRQKDGALCILGSLKNILLNKKYYRDKISTLLNRFIYPEFCSPMGHLRARACWVLQCFASGIRFETEGLLQEAVNLTVGALLSDSELPVKVEAVLAIQVLLTSQEKVHDYLLPHVQEVTKELLKINHDSIVIVLGQIIPSYTEQLIPIAYEILNHLAATINKVVYKNLSKDEKDIAAINLINMMETVLEEIQHSPEILDQIHKTMLQVAELTMDHNIGDCYQLATSLLSYLTLDISCDDTWDVLEEILTHKLYEEELLEEMVL